MTDNTRRNDIIHAIMNGNVEMNRDVSLVIACFARDLEICHASVQQIQSTRFESVVWNEFSKHTLYPKVCEAAIEQLSRRDTRATRYPVVFTNAEFDLLFTALNLHSTNEYIQRNGFQLLYSSLLSMERVGALHLGEERIHFIYTQMAAVVCNVFTNFPNPSRARFVTIIGINHLQCADILDPSHLREFHVKLLEYHFLGLAMSLLEEYINVGYKCSAIVNVVDSVVNEHDAVLCEAVKSNAQIHVLLKRMDELPLESEGLDERSCDKLKSFRAKLFRISKQ